MSAGKQRKPAGPVLYFFCWVGAVWGGLSVLSILERTPQLLRDYAQMPGGVTEYLVGVLIVWVIAFFCILEIRDTRKARKMLAAQAQGKDGGLV
jgi:hypothetical protein